MTSLRSFLAVHAILRRSPAANALLLTIILCMFPHLTMAQRPEIVVQQGLPDFVTSAAFSPDGSLLAISSSLSRTVQIWQVATGRELRSFAGHTEYVNTVAFSPDGKTLATGSRDKTVRIWDVITGETIKVLDAQPLLEVYSVSYSPDGRLLAAGGFSKQPAPARGTIKLWDVTAWKELPAPPGHTERCNSLAFTPDSKKLVSGGQDHLVTAWDVASAKEVRTFRGHSEPVLAIAISHDGKRLASGGGEFVLGKDTNVRIWDLETGRLLRTIPGSQQQIKAVDFSPDGRSLISAGGGTVLWDVDTGNKIHEFTNQSSSSQWAIFSPDGHTLAAANSDPKLTLWDVATGNAIREFVGHSRIVATVAFAPNSRTLVTGSLLGNARIWNTPIGIDSLTSKEGSHTFVPGSDGKSLLDHVNRKIVRRSLDTATETGTITTLELPYDQITLSPNGRLLAGTSRFAPDMLKVWDVASGRTLWANKRRDLLTFHLAFSPDGKTLAGCGLAENREGNRNVRTWDVATGRELRTFAGHEGRCDAITFSPDGKTMASGAIDNLIKFWDPATGNEIRTLKGHTDWLTALVFTPDGKTLASASCDGTIRLWNPITGEEIRALKGHADRVLAIDIGRDGKLLASGSQDGTTRLWDMSTGRELASLVAIDQDDWLVATPDGLFDGSPGAWNQILWRFARNTFDVVPVEAFFNEFYYPGLLSDILSGQTVRAPRDIQQFDRRQPELRLTLAGNQTADNAPREVKVRIEVGKARAGSGPPSGGVRDVRLFRNGALVKLWRGDVLKTADSTSLETAVTIVAGENRLTAYAFNEDNIKSADAKLVVNGADDLKREGTAYVIAVGVNQYANKEFDLKYAAADAESFGAEFQRAQSAVGKFAKTEVVLLLNQNATKANLLRALNRLQGGDATPLAAGDPLEKIKPAQPEDAVVIYFSGHGTAQQNRFYLIPHDLGYAGARDDLDKDAKALAALCDHSVSDRELEESFEKIDAGQLLLIIDACHSGQALEAEEKRRGPMNSRGLAQLAYEKGMYVLTASQSYQVAVGSRKLGHGYLTYALVTEGLGTNKADDAPADGQILIREWLAYATRRVPNMQNDESQEIRDLVQPEGTNNSQERPSAVQRPRVFYRRELEPEPLIIAKP